MAFPFISDSPGTENAEGLETWGQTGRSPVLSSPFGKRRVAGPFTVLTFIPQSEVRGPVLCVAKGGSGNVAIMELLRSCVGGITPALCYAKNGAPEIPFWDGSQTHERVGHPPGPTRNGHSRRDDK